MTQFTRILIASALSIVFTSQASAATANCAQNPGALAAALASATPGSTIQIVGTCRGRYTLTTSVTLSGTPNATIDGNGAGPVITVLAGVHAVLDGLTVTGGNSTAPVAVGGIANAGQLELRRSRVIGNVAHGETFATGGIASGPVGSAWLSLDRSEISGNVASVSNAGPAVSTAAGGLRTEGPVSLDRSEVRGNQADAITVSGNRAFGAMRIGAGAARIDRSVISDNTARAEHTGFSGTGLVAGAIAGITQLSLTDELLIDRSLIQHNSATAMSPVGSGAAGGMVSRLTTIANSDIVDNVASAGTLAVGGIANHNAVLVLEKSTLSGNSATASEAAGVAGGGMVTGYVAAASTTLIKSDVVDNIAFGTTAVGGLFQVAGNGTHALDKTTVADNTPGNCNFAGCQP